MASSGEAVANKALVVNSLGVKNITPFQQLVNEFCGDKECSSHENYLWSVENKYYQAKILLQYCHVGEDGQMSVKADSYEAVVILLDCTHVDFVSDIWTKLVQQLGTEFEVPSVCLLVAVVGEREDKPLEPVLKWCVENGFELIEWSPGEGKASGGGSLLEDSAASGTARLVEALEAHVWPDMTMKSKSSGGTKSVPKPATAADDKLASILSENEKLLAEGLDGEKEEGEQSFEELFAKFAEMKAHAQQLPHEQRKDYAEKVVLAFWEAIGGDEEEVKDLT